jgi:DNA-binding transcriptional MerR regulator
MAIEKKQVIYNITELALKLGVPRQTIYYWIEKGWVKPKRDYRNYPVFTESDLEEIIKWKTTFH